MNNATFSFKELLNQIQAKKAQVTTTRNTAAAQMWNTFEREGKVLLLRVNDKGQFLKAHDIVKHENNKGVPVFDMSTFYNQLVNLSDEELTTLAKSEGTTLEIVKETFEGLKELRLKAYEADLRKRITNGTDIKTASYTQYKGKYVLTWVNNDLLLLPKADINAVPVDLPEDEDNIAD